MPRHNESDGLPCKSGHLLAGRCWPGRRQGVALIILVLLVGLVLVACLAAASDRLRPASGRPPVKGVVGQLRPTGSFGLDVVGEASYQHAIGKIAGGRTEEGISHLCEAVLVPEPANPHDPMAVRVDIEGATVGYLSRANAREYRAELRRLGFEGGVFSCQALIVGGWDRGSGDRGHFGVKLDVPVND